MGKFIDETGNKYGKLTVLYKAETEKGKPIKWHCLCECGNEKDILGTMLRNGNTKSCGCLQRKRAAESNIARAGGELTGKKFCRLTVLEEFLGKIKDFVNANAIVEILLKYLLHV